MSSSNVNVPEVCINYKKYMPRKPEYFASVTAEVATFEVCDCKSYAIDGRTFGIDEEGNVNPTDSY